MRRGKLTNKNPIIGKKRACRNQNFRCLFFLYARLISLLFAFKLQHSSPQSAVAQAKKKYGCFLNRRLLGHLTNMLSAEHSSQRISSLSCALVSDYYISRSDYIQEFLCIVLPFQLFPPLTDPIYLVAFLSVLYSTFCSTSSGLFI